VPSGEKATLFTVALMLWAVSMKSVGRLRASGWLLVFLWLAPLFLELCCFGLWEPLMVSSVVEIAAGDADP
jgi:hypothetical protein